MAHRRAEVEETSLYAKKFVRYEEGAKKYSIRISSTEFEEDRNQPAFMEKWKRGSV